MVRKLKQCRDGCHDAVTGLQEGSAIRALSPGALSLLAFGAPRFPIDSTVPLSLSGAVKATSARTAEEKEHVSTI